MTEDVDSLRAENAALRAENDAMRARYDPARRTWTASEISVMDHGTYTENKREILAAFREGRIVRDPDPDAGRAERQERRREPAARAHDERNAGPCARNAAPMVRESPSVRGCLRGRRLGAALRVPARGPGAVPVVCAVVRGGPARAGPFAAPRPRPPSRPLGGPDASPHGPLPAPGASAAPARRRPGPGRDRGAPRDLRVDRADVPRRGPAPARRADDGPGGGDRGAAEGRRGMSDARPSAPPRTDPIAAALAFASARPCASRPSGRTLPVAPGRAMSSAVKTEAREPARA